jgi:hypothetical protein
VVWVPGHCPGHSGEGLADRPTGCEGLLAVAAPQDIGVEPRDEPPSSQAAANAAASSRCSDWRAEPWPSALDVPAGAREASWHTAAGEQPTMSATPSKDRSPVRARQSGLVGGEFRPLSWRELARRSWWS